MSSFVCLSNIHNFFIHSSVDGHLGCFHVVAMVNSATMNTGVPVSFSILVFSGYTLGLGLLGQKQKILRRDGKNTQKNCTKKIFMTQIITMVRSEEHTSELQSPLNLVCRLLLEKKKHLVWRGAQRRTGSGVCWRSAGRACA